MLFTPPFFIPIIAFLFWLAVVLAYFPLLKLDLHLSEELLAPQLLISSFILVLVWALSGPITALVLTVLAIFTMLYLCLAVKEPSFFIQIIYYVAQFIVMVFYLYEIQKKNNFKQINREKLVEELNLVREEQQKKDVLEVSLQKKVERFLSFQHFSEDLKQVKSLSAASQKIVYQAHEMLSKADECVLYLVNEAKQELMLVASTRKSGEVVKEKEGSIFDDWVMKKARAVVIDDSKNDFRFALESRQGLEHLRSVCASPLMTDNKVLGVLRASSQNAHQFSTDDLRILDIISSFGSVITRNILLYEKMQELALRDSLTGLYLNRYFQERISEEIVRANFNSNVFSILLLDIDYFKHYNDEYGHAAGDLVLKNISALIAKHVGVVDLAARYGGEEFVMVFPKKNKKEASKLAERIRQEVEKHKFYLRRIESRVTVSLGVATFPDDGRTKEELVWAVDRNLYEAKNTGRNRVCGNI